MSSRETTNQERPKQAGSRQKSTPRRKLLVQVLLVLSVLIVMVVVAGALFFKMTGQHLPVVSTTEVAQKLDPNAFPSAGIITFTGPDSTNPTLNPTEVALTDIGFDTVSITWQIRNADTNDILDSGPGDQVSEALAELKQEDDGSNYMIDFFVANDDYQIYGDSAAYSVTR